MSVLNVVVSKVDTLYRLRNSGYKEQVMLTIILKVTGRSVFTECEKAAVQSILDSVPALFETPTVCFQLPSPKYCSMSLVRTPPFLVRLLLKGLR